MERIEIRPLNSLRSHPENATIFGDPETNKRELAHLNCARNRLEKLGVYDSLLIADDGTILSGYMRWRAYSEAGIEEAKCEVTAQPALKHYQLLVREKVATRRLRMTLEEKAWAWKILRGKPGRKTFVYFIQAGDDGPIKIGVAENIVRRIAQLQTACPYPLRLIGKSPGYMGDESRLHTMFSRFRLKGEWFAPAPEIISHIQEGR